MLTLKLTLGRVKVYEESREFWECSALTVRLALPLKLRPHEIEEDTWFCRASLTEWELYLLLDGLEKFTDALNVVPGWDLGSWECDHLKPKFLVSSMLTLLIIPNFISHRCM